MPEIISTHESPVPATVQAHTIPDASLDAHEVHLAITHPALTGPLLAHRAVHEVETAHPHITVYRVELQEVDATGAATGLRIQPWHHTISDEAAAHYLTVHPDRNPYDDAIAHCTQMTANKLLHAKMTRHLKGGVPAAAVPLPTGGVPNAVPQITGGPVPTAGESALPQPAPAP